MHKSSLLYAGIANSLRTWQIFVMILLIVNIMQVTVISTLFPLKETKPVFVQFSTSDDVYFKTIPQDRMTATQEEFLIRNFLTKYVHDREARDDMELILARAAFVKDMSSKGVYESLIKDFSKQQETMQDVTREVHVISDSPISLKRQGDTSMGVHQVEWLATDRKGEYYTKTSFVATIHYTYEFKEVNETQAMLNPFNIKIVKYQLSKKQNIVDTPKSSPMNNDNPFVKTGGVK